MCRLFRRREPTSSGYFYIFQRNLAGPRTPKNRTFSDSSSWTGQLPTAPFLATDIAKKRGILGQVSIAWRLSFPVLFYTALAVRTPAGRKVTPPTCAYYRKTFCAKALS